MNGLTLAVILIEAAVILALIAWIDRIEQSKGRRGG